MLYEVSQSKGYVYILINPSMPGLLKIGKSIRSPEIRAMELSQATGVPYSFQVVYQTLVDNCDLAEKEIHNSLNTYRAKKNREFFRIPLNQAIDLIRRVIAEKNLKSNDLDVEPYKFAFEEFNSPEALFSQILYDEDKWEKAKLHLKNGYLEDWLKKKGEFDALINIEKYSDRKDQEDFFLSLISFSVVSSRFRLFGYNLESLSSLYQECSNSSTKERLIRLLFSGRLSVIYEGFLKSKAQDEDKMLKWFRFVESSNKYDYENRKVRMMKILEWKLYPSSFLHFEKMNFEKADYLINKSQWLTWTSQIPVPQEILNDFDSTDERRLIKAIKEILFFKSVFIDPKPNRPLRSHKEKDWYLDGLMNYVPSAKYIQEGKRLASDEYRYFIEGLISQERIRDLSSNYFFPLKLIEHLTEEGQLVDFIYAKEILRYMFLYDTRLEFPENGYSEEGDAVIQYDFIISEVRRKYKKYLSKGIPNVENKGSDDGEGVFYSFWECQSTRKKMQTFFDFTRNFLLRNLEKERMFRVKKLLLRKESLELEKEKFIQEHVIPSEEERLFQKDSFSFFDFFENNYRPRIQRSDLIGRLIPSSLIDSFNSATVEEHTKALNCLYFMFSRKKLENKPLQIDWKKGHRFNLKVVPTQEFINNLILPSTFIEKLKSQDLERYSEGINQFHMYRNYLLPKKTFNALDQEFVLPSDIKSKILGNCIIQYIDAMKILNNWGLENKAIWWSEFFGVKNPTPLEEGYRNKPISQNHYKEKFQIYRDGWEKKGFEYTDSVEITLQNLKNSEVKMALMINLGTSKLIKKKDVQLYTDSLREGGAKYFYNSFTITSINYVDFYNVINKGYDKRLDEVVSSVLEKIDKKLHFLHEEIIELLKGYLERVLKVKEVMTSKSEEFIYGLYELTQRSLISLFFNKKEVNEFLKKNLMFYKSNVNEARLIDLL